MEQITLDIERKSDISIDTPTKYYLKDREESKEISDLKKSRVAQVKYIEHEM